jgi:hypothetical protein
MPELSHRQASRHLVDHDAIENCVHELFVVGSVSDAKNPTGRQK